MTASVTRVCGTRVKYVIERCRCAPCTAANLRATKQLELRKLAGEQIWYDAAPVRAHVRDLSAAGLGWKRVAAVSGVSTGGMSKLLYGAPGRSAPARIRYATAMKILAVKADPALAHPSAVIDATGTIRRLQALVAVGWNLSELARRLGMTRSNLGHLLDQTHVIARTARAVVELYSGLWDALPPADTAAQRTSITKAKKMAAARGWVPPMAWDDEKIDVPAGRPAGARRDRARVCTQRVELLNPAAGAAEGQS